MPSTLTKAFAPFDLKAVNDDARTFEGLSSTWEQDLGGDVIHRGAYRRTLDHWKQSGRVIPLLDMHPYKLSMSHSVARDTLGKLLDAEERDDGLWTKFKVARTTAGDDLMALLKDGMVEGLSVGVRPINPTPREGGGRDLKELELKEVSMVTFGMNEGALIDLSTVKSLLQDDLTDEKRAELESYRDQIDALLKAAGKPAPPEGLAPDDPKRAAVESRLRSLRLANLRSLATR